MLWVNGYTSNFFHKLGLTPLPGEKYWRGNFMFAADVLKDWQSLFIDPNSFMFSSAKSRFHKGYIYASLYDSVLSKHIMLCGNQLNIVAHSHGVAFAEGIAAYFYEEKGIVTESLIAIQGSQMKKTPQSKNAIRNRILLKTNGDLVANKKGQNLRFCNAIIVEKPLLTGFCKYEFYLPDFYEKYNGTPLYLKGTYSKRKAHCVHRYRQFQLWSAIGHAIKLLRECRKEDMELTDELDRISSLIAYYKNYN